MNDITEINKIIRNKFSKVQPLRETCIVNYVEKTGAKIVYSYKKPCTFEQFLNSILIGKKNIKLLVINELRQNSFLKKKFKYDENGYHKILYQPYFTENDLNVLSNTISLLLIKYNIILDKNVI